MTDPFGAIHNQNIGDLGVHIGNGQWAVTSPGLTISPTTKKITMKSSASDTSDPNSVTRNAVTGGDVLTINQGSVAHPVTVQGATLYVSRYSNMSTGGDSNAAIFASAYNNGTTQPVGVFAEVTQNGNGDAAGFYANVVNTHAGKAAFGAFYQVSNTASGGGAIAIETNTVNATGADSAYTTGLILGWDAAYGGSSAKYGGAVIQIRAGTTTDRWDAGIYVAGDAIRSYVVDAAAATTATSWHGKFSVDNEVQITRAAGSAYFIRMVGTGGGANTWGQWVDGAGSFVLTNVTGGNIQFAVIAGATPGANNTNAYFMEGATPTLRRLTTFNPGAAGINFTNGQLVCVLV